MSSEESSFYVIGGTLRRDDPSYVERQADTDLIAGLRQRQFCYVLTSRQMGKSSLMVRTASKLREEGVNIVVLDLSAIGRNLTPDQWYDGLVARMGQQVHLEDELDRFWDEHQRLGPCLRFFTALFDVVMARHPEPLVIFIDEIDAIRSLPFPADEFFASIRACFNRRAQEEAPRRLAFCLLGAATLSDLVRDTRTTPFNIARRIELHDFTDAEAAPLARGLARHGSEEVRTRLLERVLHWTGGHPYLTQRLCCEATLDPGLLDKAGIDGVCAELFLSPRARERDDNLLFVRERLLRSEADLPSLLELYLRVWKGSRVPDDETSQVVSVLRLSGVVKATQGRLVVRNRIYSRVFDSRWVDAQMPDADRRRQQAAFRRGMIRATAIAAVVVVALTVAVWFAVIQKQMAYSNLARSYISEAKVRRTSGVVEQRTGSLSALEKAGEYHEDRTLLRDETIACLALMDLEPIFSLRTNLPADTVAVALHPTLTRHLRAGGGGGITLVHHADERSEALPSSSAAAAWMLMSPNGRFLAAGHPEDPARRFVVWDLESGAAVVQSTEMVRESAVDFSRDNGRIAIGFPGSRIEVFRLPDGERVTSLELQQAAGIERVPACVRFDGAGQRVAECAPDSQRVYVWDLADRSSYYLFHTSEISALAWSPDDQRLAASGRAAVSIWDLQFQRRRDVVQPHSDSVHDLVFSPDGALLASVGADRALRLWSAATGRQVTQTLLAEPSGRLLFSSDSHRLGLAGVRTGIQIWKVHGNEEYRAFRVPAEINAPFTSVGFDPEGRVLMAANDLGAFFWDTVTGRSQPSLQVQSVQSLFADPASGGLYVTSPKGLFHWPREAGSTPGGLFNRFGPSRHFELPAGLGQSSRISERKRGIVIHRDHLHQFEITPPFGTAVLPFKGAFQALALSPDDRWLATWGDGREIKVWSTDPEAGLDPVVSFEAGGGFVFSPDSRLLIYSSREGYQLRDTADWAGAGDLGPATRGGDQNKPVAIGTLSQGGTLLATVDEAGDINVFALAHPPGRGAETELLARLSSPDRKRILHLDFSAGCTRLAAGGADLTIEVWNLHRVQQYLARRGLEGRLPALPPGPADSTSIEISQELNGESIPDQLLIIETIDDYLAAHSEVPAAKMAAILKKRGKAYMKLGRMEEAEADFSGLVGLEPDDIANHQLLDQARKGREENRSTP